MQFNSDKFEALCIGKNDNLKKDIQYKTPEGEIINTTYVAKDLGVHFNDKGTFSAHIKLKSTQAKKMAGRVYPQNFLNQRS